MTTWISGERAFQAEGIANTKALKQESAWYIQGTSRSQSTWNRQTTYIKTVTKHTQICDVCEGNKPLGVPCALHDLVCQPYPEFLLSSLSQVNPHFIYHFLNEASLPQIMAIIKFSTLLFAHG